MEHKDEFEQQTVQVEKDPLGTIAAIPFQVKQLIENLISNSVKYKHPERACIIKIKGEVLNALPADKQPRRNRPFYHFSVSDNGVGFDDEQAEKIFEIFQRLNNLPNSKGSGIGLAICKRIVENHNGLIKATGKVNEGACFDVYLPLQQS